MPYTPTTWNTGDMITASALNKIEQGIADAGGGSGSGALVVNVVSGTLDKTFLEIYTALRDGIPSYVKEVSEEDGPSTDYESRAMLQPIVDAHKYNDIYAVYIYRAWEGQVSGNYYAGSPCVTTFHATSVNGYPTLVGDTVASNVSFYD